MIYNQLWVLPTQETLNYLSSLMQGASLDIDLNSFKVEIITTLDDGFVVCPDNMYSATGLSLKTWYDGYLQDSSLILSLHSDDLMARALELNQQGIVREGGDFYNPHLVVRQHMPSLNVTYRRFVNSMANVLCSDVKLWFGCEHAITVDLPALPDHEYNMAMSAERHTRRNW
jgi:hypothetical protein